MSLLRFSQLAEIIRRDYRAEINIGNFLLFRRDEDWLERAGIAAKR